MQTVVSEILAPFSTLEETLPKDVSASETIRDFGIILKKMIGNVRPAAKPVLANISGLPGSGKTHVARRMIQENPNQVYIAFDLIMEQLPAYIAEAQQDRKKAYERWEIPARFTGYRLLSMAIERRLPVLFEHSNANPHHIALYEKIKQAGYEVEIRYIDADPDLVLPRLSRRDRFFALDRVRERADLLNKILPEYQKTATRFITLGAWKE